MSKISSPREEYLNKHWEKYPPSSLSDIRGRVVELTNEICTLETSAQKTKYNMKPTISLAPGFSALVCLVVGDIVEVQLEKGSSIINTIKLLVPSQAEAPFLKSDFDMKRAQTWNYFIKEIRDFFVKKEFIELRTPTLVPSPGLEPFLDPFKTKFNFGQSARELYLPTSPEFHLKKALTLGFEKIFEFKDCFRNGEQSQTHSPEFLMLEWYRAYEKTESIIEDVENLFKDIQRVFRPEALFENIMVFKMEDLWKDILNFNLKPDSNLIDLVSLAEGLALGSTEMEFDDLFNLIFLEKIEPYLKKMRVPTIVWHYPPSQAALSRLTHDGWADRFEVYWRGFEIANAFHELNDYEEQKLRFKVDQEKKKKLGKEVVPLDEEFMGALKWGMPPSAGIALGVERLFMALFNLNEINQCRLFRF